MPPTTARRLVVAGVAVSLAGTLGHGLVHGYLDIAVPTSQLTVAIAVTVGGPLLGLVALRRSVRLAAWIVLVASMLALGVEGVLHFVVPGPDNVATVPARSFDATALSTTVTDGLGAALAAVALGCERGYSTN